MIRVQNVFYMLSYAIGVLNESGYKSVAAEKFDNTAELFAAILSRGISLQLKRGLGKEYVPRTDSVSPLRGKIDLSASVKNKSLYTKQFLCSYDEFSVDSYFNRIIKTTVMILMHSEISKPRKRELCKLMFFFKDVELINPFTIDWRIHFNRNNSTYRMLISVCSLVINGLLQTTSPGNIKLNDFPDERCMCRLYEKFILEYYRKEYPQINVNSGHIDWALNGDRGSLLPAMKTDIMLSFNGKTLIIDAKYYSHSTQTQYDTHTIHSRNLYQIFTYVKNKAAEDTEVSGLLLYAKTDDIIQPCGMYNMSGNQISVKTLNLDCDFSETTAELNAIAEAFMA